MCNKLTSIPAAICLYLALISSLHRPLALLNHNSTVLCHIQFPLHFTKCFSPPCQPVPLLLDCIAGVICGTWDAVALTASSAFIAASHCELLFPLLQMCFLFGLGASKVVIFLLPLTGRPSESRVRVHHPAEPLLPRSSHTKILLWEELRIAVWTSH